MLLIEFSTAAREGKKDAGDYHGAIDERQERRGKEGRVGWYCQPRTISLSLQVFAARHWC